MKSTTFQLQNFREVILAKGIPYNFRRLNFITLLEYITVQFRTLKTVLAFT